MQISGYSNCLGPPSEEVCKELKQGRIQSCLDEDPPYLPLTKVNEWRRDGWDEEARCPIRIRVHWMGLEDVSTVLKTFKAKLWIQLKWRENLPLCFSPSDRDQGIPIKELQEHVGVWVPNLSFENILRDGEAKDAEAKATHVYHKKGDQYATIYHRTLVSGTFSCKMNLRTFPFDQQRLSVRVALWNCPEQVMGHSLGLPGPDQKPPTGRTVKLELGDSQLYASNFTETNAWTFLHNVEVKQGLTAVKRNDDFVQYTTINIFITLRRKQLFYYLNIVLTMFLLGLSSFTIFFLDNEALDSRLNIQVTLLLTAVAFRFVISSYLPVTSYMTILDYYVLSLFFLLSLVAGQCMILKNLVSNPNEDDRDAILFNRWSGLSLAVLWIFFHCCIPFVSIYMSQLNDKLLDHKKDEPDAFIIACEKLKSDPKFKAHLQRNEERVSLTRNLPSRSHFLSFGEETRAADRLKKEQGRTWGRMLKKVEGDEEEDAYDKDLEESSWGG